MRRLAQVRLLVLPIVNSGFKKLPNLPRQNASRLRSRLLKSRFRTAVSSPHLTPRMYLPEQSNSDEVEHLLRNAQLRDELDPLYDESIGRVNARAMSTRTENEFLESMLEWERAPILPICEWFEPPLVLPHPDHLSPEQLNSVLKVTIEKLFEEQIVLDFTDHLTDYQLYCIIYRDILPAHEKKLNNRSSYLHWDCADTGGDPETWLRYYATQQERRRWAEEHNIELPPQQKPPYVRELPRAPL